jgi:hypothetical protein
MRRKSWFRAVNIRREGMRDTISGERAQTGWPRTSWARGDPSHFRTASSPFRWNNAPTCFGAVMPRRPSQIASRCPGGSESGARRAPIATAHAQRRARAERDARIACANATPLCVKPLLLRGRHGPARSAAISVHDGGARRAACGRDQDRERALAHLAGSFPSGAVNRDRQIELAARLMRARAAASRTPALRRKLRCERRQPHGLEARSSRAARRWRMRTRSKMGLALAGSSIHAPR